MAGTAGIRKDDTVIVTVGRDKGKRGKVLAVNREAAKVVVEGVRVVKRHTKPNPKNQQGGIMEFEAPVAISNVMVVCGACGKPTRIGRKRLTDGTGMRVCKHCGESVDKK